LARFKQGKLIQIQRKEFQSCSQWTINECQDYRFEITIEEATGWSISLGASPMQSTEASPVTAVGSTQTLP
jgi:hypothetical protein